MSIPFLSGHIWKIATGGAAALALLLCALLMSSYFENRDLSKQRNTLAAQINDPQTGYIAQLAQARTNVETLKVEVDKQNKALDKMSAESNARLAAARTALAKAQAETKALEKRLAGFLATKPQGATLEARVRDIDARAMKEFLP
jgi:DNA anti-recombination protein RmuC